MVILCNAADKMYELPLRVAWGRNYKYPKIIDTSDGKDTG